MIRIRIAVIIIQDRKILLVKHHKYEKEYWLLPGGGLEHGETIEFCAKRELKEEANLEIELGDLVLVNESIPPDKHRHVLNLCYWAKLIGGEIKVGKDGVLVDAQFVPIDQIPGLKMYPNIKKELIAVINQQYQGNISIGNKWD
ncbi:MAG: NUDIX domain-containing protein [bacterium]